MEPLPPSADRIGAALKALQRTHTRSGEREDSLSLGAKCLHAVIAQLAEDGVPQEDLQPLIELEAHIRQTLAQSPGAAGDRRKGRPPSDRLLARGAAVIDLLIKAGSEEGEAAQIVMRRLMTAGVPPPQQGGDARGWRRLLEWRAALVQGLGSHEAQEEYQEFGREIEAIPANERVRRVLDERLWDRRRKPR
jgi:hypothetical protein